uniref:CMP/dCMP-type deaminase domain-containing protein n=1 Tax=Gouania willdenowi TaxID=441366 RepID=A0A8C5DHV6_GOUWI
MLDMIKRFIYHYNNMRWARGRHETYLCFVVKRRIGPDTLSFDFGHLRNRTGCHVEVSENGQCIRCTEKHGFDQMYLTYSITWFCSWSPCADCSSKLAQFLRQTPNLRLRIFVSRLYFCDREDGLEREGLRMLKRAGVHITVMSYKGNGKKGCLLVQAWATGLMRPPKKTTKSLQKHP